jgi:hypothetical protein
MDANMAKEVEVRQIELTTPDRDFIEMWLATEDSPGIKDNPGINLYIEGLLRNIFNQYERAEVKEIL